MFRNFQSITVIMDTEFVLEGWWKSSKMWWWWWLHSLCVTKFYGMSQNLGSFWKMKGLFSSVAQNQPQGTLDFFPIHTSLAYFFPKHLWLSDGPFIGLFVVSWFQYVNSMLIGILSVWFFALSPVSKCLVLNVYFWMNKWVNPSIRQKK